MALLGLLTTEDFQANRFKSVRRSVLYNFPAGAATLTGLTSMLKEEVCNDPEIFWFEKRLTEQKSVTVANIAAGPFADTANANLAGAQTEGTIIRLAVEDATQFRQNHVVEILNVSGAPTKIRGIVTDVFPNTAVQRIEIKLQTAITTLTNTTANNGKTVIAVGVAYAQGAHNISGGRYRKPTKIGNLTQIFRTPFEVSSTALKTPLEYDKTGVYKDLLKDNSLEHAIAMEKAFIWGTRYTDFDQDGKPKNQMGGIIYFLEQWALTSNNPYGWSAAAAADPDHQRIIDVNGNITESQLETYLERLFRTTSNSADEKLCLCGSGFLKVLNQLFKGKSVLQADFPAKDAYGMQVVRYITPFGTVWLKSHPLMNQSPIWRDDALFIDVHNLKYRFMQDRDTTLLKNRQLPDADYRKDEFLTECSLEVHFPESHMLLRGVTGYTP